MKFSTYYFHMKTKILVDFQICISVPLTVAGLHCIKLGFNSEYMQTVLLLTKMATNLSMFLTFLKWKSKQDFAKKNWYKSYKTFYILLEKVLNCTLLHLDSIFAESFGGLAHEPSTGNLQYLTCTPWLLELVTKFSRITSEKITGTLVSLVVMKDIP